MDIIGISGLVVSVAGFGLALWQLRKTRYAAEAAAAAAQETARAIRLIDSVATIHDICGRSRDLLHLTREGSLKSAAIAAFELLDSIAHFHVTGSGRSLATQVQWQAIIKAARWLHQRLESAAIKKRISSTDRTALITAISKIHRQPSVIATIASDRGAYDGNS